MEIGKEEKPHFYINTELSVVVTRCHNQDCSKIGMTGYILLAIVLKIELKNVFSWASVDLGVLTQL